MNKKGRRRTENNEPGIPDIPAENTTPWRLFKIGEIRTCTQNSIRQFSNDLQGHFKFSYLSMTLRAE